MEETEITECLSLACFCSDRFMMVPNGEVDNPPVNFISNNLMSKVAQHMETETKDLAITCEKCGFSDPAIMRCRSCFLFFCDLCSQFHKRDKTTCYHKHFTIEELKSLGPSSLSKPVLCKVHDGMHLKLYCESCEQVISTNCVVIEHSGWTKVTEKSIACYLFGAEIPGTNVLDIRMVLCHNVEPERQRVQEDYKGFVKLDVGGNSFLFCRGCDVILSSYIELLDGAVITDRVTPKEESLESRNFESEFFRQVVYLKVERMPHTPSGAAVVCLVNNGEKREDFKSSTRLQFYLKACAKNEDAYEKKKETTLQGNPCASSAGTVEEIVKNKEAYTKKKMVFLAIASAKVLAFIAMLAVAVFCFRSLGSVDRDQLPPITSTRSPTSASKSLASTSSGVPSCINPRGSGSSKGEYCKDAITEKVQSETKSETSGHIKKLMVVLLCSEWGSLKGGLSTFNRQLAIYLAKLSDLEVSCYLPKVSDHDKNAALKDDVTLFEAEDIPGNKDPLVKLQHWSAKLPSPDVIISHGRKFGPAAYLIKNRHPSCKWVHFVHVNYEEMGKYKVGSNEIRENNRKYKDELWYCQQADVVVAVGPQLLDCYSRSLFIEQKEVQVFYPGLSKEFQNLTLTSKEYESTEFHIYIFCRCSPKNLELKGVDLLADAVGKLGKKYKMYVVGVPEDEEVNIFQHTLEKTAVTKNQLYVWEYCNDREDLKRLMGKADLVVMPSRAEAFGLIGLEALSAGVPLLVSSTSGLGMTLKKLTFGDICVVESDDPQEWAKKIELLKEKDRPQRIKRMKQVRNQYDEEYKWDEQCSILAKLF